MICTPYFILSDKKIIASEIIRAIIHKTISSKTVDAVSFKTCSYSFPVCFDVSLLTRMDNIAKNAEIRMDKNTDRCSANSLVSAVTCTSAVDKSTGTPQNNHRCFLALENIDI